MDAMFDQYYADIEPPAFLGIGCGRLPGWCVTCTQDISSPMPTVV